MTRERIPRRSWRAAATLALALALTLAASASASERMGLLVPAYQYPTLGSLWADCAAAATRAPLIAVLDPASGPGAGVDPTYTAAVGAVRAAGGRVVGYVPTFGAAAPPETVLAQVDRYRAWYALDGIFLDIMANDADAGHIAYYTMLRDSIRARQPAWLVVGNPGTTTQEGYLDGADLLCDFESYGEGYFTFAPESWAHTYPASRFAHLLHSLSTADSMRAAVMRARDLHAGWVYVTHDTMPNPYDQTPAYWSTLVAVVETTWVAAVPPSPAPSAARLRAWPVPSRGAVWFELAGAPLDAALELFDLGGRRVARVALDRGGRGHWDGRDLAGRRLPAGAYLARVPGQAPSSSAVFLHR
jgi:hypothetical protein